MTCSFPFVLAPFTRNKVADEDPHDHHTNEDFHVSSPSGSRSRSTRPREMSARSPGIQTTACGAQRGISALVCSSPHQAHGGGSAGSQQASVTTSSSTDSACDKLISCGYLLGVGPRRNQRLPAPPALKKLTFVDAGADGCDDVGRGHATAWAAGAHGLELGEQHVFHVMYCHI